ITQFSDFIFSHLEVFLLVGMGFMIYALFNTFTEFISQEAVFIREPDRLAFAQTLIFGLMGVEVLLALATSYFRRRSEWMKSILVTLVAFIITYYNHQTIAEIFREIEGSSHAVEVKLMLVNWLIFGLGEIASLLMNSKGQDAQQVTTNPALVPDWFQHFAEDLRTSLAHNQASHFAPGVNTSPIIPSSVKTPAPTDQAEGRAQAEIGFKVPSSTPRRSKRGPSLDYTKMQELIGKGLRTKDIATVMNCSEASVRKLKNQRKGEG
ncbi:MAG: hypothetical protein HC880_06915, partial [Bacteroidia bacterium]|nr:hypothetical protein [Bacteroidia bacterium]